MPVHGYPRKLRFIRFPGFGAFPCPPTSAGRRTGFDCDFLNIPQLQPEDDTRQ